ncbi:MULTISPECIES: alpha/beta hydrolase [unclassified Gluconobacter]|uniref:RBBP9/YdeN family alpha/beta hydrolase n=1 Tax=unclassified Gluconobacter TaxID=2644261 RepID=UPI001C04108A|nr:MULTISPECIES: alpha/beta fold hydrolase [unclassified Gluconobacter]
MNLFSGRATALDLAASARALSFQHSSEETVLAAEFHHIKTQFTPLLVPGLFGSGQHHWQTRWETAFGLPRLNQTDWENPTPEEWDAALTQAIQQAEKPVLLIAHSLGAVLTMRWLAQHESSNVAGAFLVAPADIEHTTHPEASRINAFAPLSEAPSPVPVAMMASRNDQWLSNDRARLLAQRWQAEFTDAGLTGHVGSNDFLGLWSHGARTFISFVQRRLTTPAQ